MRARMHTYMYIVHRVHIGMYVRGTGRVKLYTRCNEHVLFRLTLVQCLARVDLVPFPSLYASIPRRTRGWPRDEIKMRRDANPRYYPADVSGRNDDDDDDDDDNGVLDAQEGNVISLGH